MASRQNPIEILYPFIRNPRCPVLSASDDSASCEPVFFQKILHYIIIMVSIYSDMVRLLCTELQSFRQNVMDFPISCNPVNCSILGFRDPLSVNLFIRLIFADYKCEYSVRAAFVLNDIKLLLFYVIFYNFLPRPAACPLIRVTVFYHKLPCVCIYVHNSRKIFPTGKSYSAIFFFRHFSIP